jgi:hypothetical protein
MTETTHLVVGAGEVGASLYAVLKEHYGDHAHIRDVDPVGVTADVLHVCIPWSATFIETVTGYADTHRATLVVVHSTVPVGTCDENGWVHSPIRGRHPNLYDGITRFVKHVGGDRAKDVAKILDHCGIPTMTHEKAATTEAGKLWELVQFGLQVAIQKDIFAWCEVNGLDGNEVYTDFAHSYNVGYQALGESRFTRPLITPEADPRIGGHCVVTNAEHLNSVWADILKGR